MRKGVRVLAVILLIFVIGAGVRMGVQSWDRARHDWYRQECQRLTKAQNWTELETRARDWAAWRPADADAGITLAVALQEQGKLEESAEVLQALPEQDPKTIAAWLELSNLQFGLLNRPFDGVATCERILQIQPRILEAHRRLIFFYAITLQRVKLTSQIYRAIELGCEPREAYVYLMLGELPIFTNGFETANHWLQKDPEAELFLVARTVQLAETLENLKEPTPETSAQVEQARQILSDYRQRFPENRSVLWYFLKNAARRSDVDEVGKLLAAVPEGAGDESVFWRYRGWFHSHRDEVAEAERAYRAAGELTPLDALIWHELADVLRRQGRLTEADTMQSVAAEGRQLRLELQKLKDAGAVTDEQLDRVRAYAEACGDSRVGLALRRRLGLPLVLGSP